MGLRTARPAVLRSPFARGFWRRQWHSMARMVSTAAEDGASAVVPYGMVRERMQSDRAEPIQ